MRLYTTKAFRARISECAHCAENETVYIERPKGRLLQLTAVPDDDAKQILKTLGNAKERALKK